MKNSEYQKIAEKEKTLEDKGNLVKKTIKDTKLSKYEIISEMYKGLQKEMKELKTILFEDLSVTPKAKEKAEKISKIVFQLQSCVNIDKGGEISANLIWLYRYIRYMSKTIQDNESMNYVKPASEIVDTLLESWNSIPVNQRF